MNAEWLLNWWNLIFLLPFGLALLYLGLYTISGVTFGDGDVDHDFDVDHDVDADADADHDISADHDADAGHDAGGGQGGGHPSAEILKKQSIEVAERNKEVAVADKGRERAEAQAGVLTAEAQRESAKQKVLTVQVTGEADRDAGKQLIAAKQVIEQNKLREQTTADVQAYTAVKKADAERQAAEAQYQARLRLAEGDAQAAAKRAEGERAVKMVDVTIGREQVGVEQARVEVERQSLANKQEFEGAALQFELEKLRIAAEREIRIAAAQAMGNMLAKAQMQIFGDPATMAAMAQQFMRAAGLGLATDGLLKTMPAQGQEMLAKVAGALASQLQPKAAEAAKQDLAGNGAAAGLAGTAAEISPQERK